MTDALVSHVRQATGGKSVRAIATELDMTHTTLGAHLKADVPDIGTVLRVARHYDMPLLPVFVAAGYITEEEARQIAGPFRLEDVSDLELSKEMLRRVVAGSASDAITEPPSEQVINDVLRSVEDARAQGKKSEYDVAADARADRTPGVEGDDDRIGL
ncbi:hypothetical protein [Leifsonia sp. P73]|uniref:hypothetical protein n=1 Tax=Leifsonia sp. P73 TaxID=3423959 RepID=UPI003DA30777